MSKWKKWLIGISVCYMLFCMTLPPLWFMRKMQFKYQTYEWSDFASASEITMFLILLLLMAIGMVGFIFRGESTARRRDQGYDV